MNFVTKIVHFIHLLSFFIFCRRILKAAAKVKITGKEFVWITTQASIGDLTDFNTDYAPIEYPVGMLGIHSNRKICRLLFVNKSGVQKVGIEI